ncbi:hypothetical protein K6Y31_19950 [Motilimonas cestriensis]|uniref:SMODS-associating 2TM beta-strand rich effector domain-containing protein n=1 Tax=Motilimonas cestriensis TaxID=2742685 RepID=A0ABS8WH06_9GAMM|nr:hypothetical protein [Motilimonas cestriensis]MCE2597051.1 hypothetical protein [Motilimonas cestriensis]
MEIIYEVSPFFTKIKMLFFMVLLSVFVIWVLTLPFQNKDNLPIKWPLYIIAIPFSMFLFKHFESWSTLNERYELYLSGGMNRVEGILNSSQISYMSDLKIEGDYSHRIEVNSFTSESGEQFYFNRVAPKIYSGGEGCLDMVLSRNIEDFYGKKMRITFLPIPMGDFKEPIKCIFKIEVEA